MSRKFISFEDVEQLADIEQLTRMLGLNAKKERTQFRCSCPVHGGERSLCISPQVMSRRGSLGVFFCQEDKTGGDRIGLVAHCMGIGQQDAAFFIAEQFGTGTVATVSSDSTVATVSKNQASSTVPQKPGASAPASPRAAPAPKKGQEPAFDPEAYAAKLAYSPEVAALGISEDDAKRLGIGFAATGFHRGSIVFAIRNDDGSVAGFVGYKDGAVKFPHRWLPPKVVPLRKQA